jgi:hypothetical protein
MPLEPRDRGRVVGEIFDNGFIASAQPNRDEFLRRAELSRKPQKEGLDVFVQNAVVGNHRRIIENSYRDFFLKLQASKNPDLEAIVFRYLRSIDMMDAEDRPDLEKGLIEEVLQDADARNMWLKAVQTRVRASSDDNKRMMREAGKEGKVIRKKMVIVGAGPIAATAATILGPFFETTVITTDDTIGASWLDRYLFINSSADKERGFEVNLPVIGLATPIAGKEVEKWNVQPDAIANAAALKVKCALGDTRGYLSGPKLGAVVTTDIAINVDDFIVDAAVDFENIRYRNERLPDGELNLLKILRLQDKVTGETTILEAENLLILTGPGEEESPIRGQATAPNSPESRSEKIFIDARNKLERDILNARQRILSLDRSIASLRTIPADDVVLSRIADLERQRSQISIKIPKVLNLSMVQRAYGFWTRFLDSDPERFPFKDLLQKDKKVVIVGGKDGGDIFREWVTLESPPEAFPPDYNKKDNMIATCVQIGSTPEVLPRQFFEAKRKRYTSTVRNPKDLENNIYGRAQSWKYAQQGLKVVVAVDDYDKGAKVEEEADYLLLAGGVSRRQSQAGLLASFGRITDVQGQLVGRGDNSLRTWVGGSAAAINGSELPGAIRRVINTLQISENTLSLWANVALAQRLCWEIATQADIDPRYIDANLKEGQRKTTNLLRDLQAEFGFSYVLRGILTDLLA